MPRARGANAIMSAAYETTYGVVPASGFHKLPFVSSALGDEQNLIPAICWAMAASRCRRAEMS